MQITINLSKTHVRLFLVLFAVMSVGLAANYVFGAPPLLQWHPLSEISADGGSTNIESTTSPGKINASYIDGSVGEGQWTASGNNISTTNTGNVGIGTNLPKEKLDVNGAIKFGDTASVCDSTNRGTIKFVAGGSGISDKAYQCIKTSLDNYQWNAVSKGGLWLNGFSYRKAITINPLTSQNGYQVLVTTGTSALISQEKMQSNCQDIRFTSGDGITPLNYWIESGCDSGSTKIWVRVANSETSMIYIYYGNPSAASASNGIATFDVFGFTGFTTVDPGSKLTVTSNKITVASETIGASNVYATVASTGDFRYDYEIDVTQSTVDGGWHVLLGDAVTNPTWNSWGINNGIGATFIANAPFGYIALEKYVSGTRPGLTSQIFLTSSTTYYISITRSTTTLTLSVFSNPGRTTHVSGSPVTLSVVNTPFTKLNVAQNDMAYAGAKTYDIQNFRARKYSSPEPTTSIGAEES